MSTHVLLVEDEQNLARGLAFNFESEGYTVEVHERGESALARLLGETAGPDVDLIVLDVMLPGISGLDLLERVRERGIDTPVLMLTARDAERDVIHGLDLGADDYLTKPFSLPVLLARARTLLRRSGGPAGSGRTFRIGDTVVHPDRFEIERGGAIASLTARELDLLALLWERRGRAVSRGQILQEVWDLHPETRTRVVDTFISRLRKLIEPDPGRPQYLHSVRAFGYRLEAD